MTWFFIVVVLFFFMNSPLLIESQKCSSDFDCLRMAYGEGFCIDGECYDKEEYGQPCSHNRQCHQNNQRCLNRKCDCVENYKWLRTRCAHKDFCDFNTDCKEVEYCSSSGLCLTGSRSGFKVSPAIIASIFIFVVVVLIIGCQIRRRRQAQIITQSLIRNQQSTGATTVIQQVTVQQPVIQPQFIPVPQPMPVYQSIPPYQPQCPPAYQPQYQEHGNAPPFSPSAPPAYH